MITFIANGSYKPAKLMGHILDKSRKGTLYYTYR
nr:MAG TPA: hypothetical protein [Bacteriophage sp.]DAV13099.1 MAG TPA: hypothetical protein [Bacteriophage sp.]